jgi:hypothetical protein
MRALFAPALVAATLVSGGAIAQGIADLPPGNQATSPLTEGIEQARPFWRGSGPTRPFMAATIDAGVVYLLPRAHFGYGKPHFRWFGAEIGSGISLGSMRSYAGIRGSMPGLDVRVGARYEHPVSQRYLPEQEAFDREELDQVGFSRGVYLAGEAEVTTSIAVPSGSIIGVVTGMYMSSVPDDVYVFEQAMRVVVDPPWMWRLRLGYLYHLGWQGTMKLGVAGEVIHLVERQSFTARLGPAISVALTHHLEAVAAVMIVAHSPDSLGLSGADLGQLGLRYRWATGDAWAAFP